MPVPKPISYSLPTIVAPYWLTTSLIMLRYRGGTNGQDNNVLIEALPNCAKETASQPKVIEHY
ncbi:hypothetical protein EJB05_13405, partial [Eragrostis curvula]